MKKYLLLLVGAGLLTFQGMSQGSEADRVPQDPKAKAILDKLAKKQESYESFSADFSYQIKNSDQNLDETKKGKMYVKGERYKVDLGDQSVGSDGEFLYTVIDKVELQINCLPEEGSDNSFMNPATMTTMYKDGFKYVLDGNSTLDGKKVAVIKLFPKDPSGKSYHTIILTVFEETSELHSMQIKDKSGNTYVFTLSSLNGKAGLQDSFFQYNEDDFDDSIDLREDC